MSLLLTVSAKSASFSIMAYFSVIVACMCLSPSGLFGIGSGQRGIYRHGRSRGSPFLRRGLSCLGMDEMAIVKIGRGGEQKTFKKHQVRAHFMFTTYLCQRDERYPVSIRPQHLTYP